ncbi:fibronectin type III domain-containing protein [Listeria booriae]|uniref:Fibronectin type III domain-containing protein n=1 Tax=Listeria booriae TaxID=1552123 RepID=A0A842ABW1_9LIST|nr:fibronectin type III domain-containing protein [Listeria booriae]
MSWDLVEGATKYEIWRDGIKVSESDTNAFKDTGLVADTDYKYQVKSVKNSLISELSPVVTIKTKESQSG